MNEKIFKEAAHWIYRRKDGPDWWTHLVLTELNPDAPKKPLSEQESRRVFEALAEQQLMVEDGSRQIGTEIVPQYKFSFGKLKEWAELADLNWFESTFPTWLIRFFIQWKNLLIAALIIILTAFLETCAEKAGEAVYNKFFPTKHDATAAPGTK
ncbi:MAG: hypothetical protein ACK5TH_22610 [Prosthecobacter sp.]|jgi:hypothetical protein